MRIGVALVLHSGAMDCLVAPKVRYQVFSDNRTKQPLSLAVLNP